MILGLSGKKRCGKSTLARLLHEKYNWFRGDLSKPITLMGITLLRYQNVSEERIRHIIGVGRDTEIITELGWKTFRWFQQTIGTDWGRMLMHTDLWTNAFINADGLKHANIVMENIRFQSEVEILRSFGGIIIRIIRHTDDDNDKHVSEQELEEIVPDHIFHNNGTPYQMLKCIEDYFDLHIK